MLGGVIRDGGKNDGALQSYESSSGSSAEM